MDKNSRYFKAFSKSTKVAIRKVATEFVWTCDTNVLRESSQKCSFQHRLIEGLAAVSKLDGKITLTILLGLALASYQSIYTLFLRIEIIGGSNSSSPPATPRIRESKKVSTKISQMVSVKHAPGRIF